MCLVVGAKKYFFGTMYKKSDVISLQDCGLFCMADSEITVADDDDGDGDDELGHNDDDTTRGGRR